MTVDEAAELRAVPAADEQRQAAAQDVFTSGSAGWRKLDAEERHTIGYLLWIEGGRYRE